MTYTKEMREAKQSAQEETPFYKDFALCRITPLTDTKISPYDGKEFKWVVGFEVNKILKPLVRLTEDDANSMNYQQFTKDASRWGEGLQRYISHGVKVGDKTILEQEKQISIDNPNHQSI
jgi:hypothetical protein